MLVYIHLQRKNKLNKQKKDFFMKEKKILLGAHITIGKGLAKAIEYGQEIGCTAIQIFTKSNRSYFVKKLNAEEIQAFKETKKNSDIKCVITHTSYLINVGSKNADTEKKSVSSLKEELSRCELLGIPYLVLHPGSHLGAGEEKCIKKIAKNLDIVLEKATGKTKILLENMAGQGTSVGYKFEHLKQIRDLCKYKKLIGVCFDTCHAYAAGYDFSDPQSYKETFKKFGQILGLTRLMAIHLNDSKTELGSRKDRHENIGKGKIPLKAFELIMKDKRFSQIPKILETPVDKNFTQYKRELKLLKKLASK